MLKKTCILIILITAYLLTACGATVSSEPVSVLNVEMSEFKFDPADLTVFAGKEIILNLKNNGGVEHEFTILKKGITAKIPFDREKQGDAILAEFRVGAQKSDEFKFILPEPGEYQVICAISGHMEAGMVATLTAK